MGRNLALGIETIDRQHRELFCRMDRLLESCAQRTCQVEAAGLLAYLDEYVVTHFTAEEELQKAYGYPDYRQHHEQHAAFIENLAFVRVEIADKGVTDSVIQHVSQMLIEWFGRHIAEQDRAMGDYLHTAMKREP